MKINDLLRESSESIMTYLALVGHDITYYEQGSAAAKAQYKENPTEAYKLALKTILAEANLRIVSLLQNTELWERLEADPEISLVYDRFVNL